MDYKEFAIHTARLAGEIIKSHFTLNMKKDWKADHTPLTEADLKINQLVIDSIKARFPTHSVLAEEGDNIQKSDFVWVCDPIDGTIPFSHGIPTCVFSLALVHKGKSIVGVIYDPFMDRMYTAEHGKGAFLNDKPIHVSDTTSLENTVANVITFHKSHYDLTEVYRAIENAGAKLIDLKSVTYMDTLVASGEMSITTFAQTKPHDTAAAKVIVEEAGGKVTDLFGAEVRMDKENKGYLVTNGHLHEHVLQIIREHVHE